MRDEDTKKRPLSREELDQLEQLAAMPDSEIDTADIPEAPLENWTFARRGGILNTVTIRLDADLLAWFRRRMGNHGYHAEINRVLREHVLAQEKKARS